MYIFTKIPSTLNAIVLLIIPRVPIALLCAYEHCLELFSSSVIILPNSFSESTAFSLFQFISRTTLTAYISTHSQSYRQFGSSRRTVFRLSQLSHLLFTDTYMYIRKLVTRTMSVDMQNRRRGQSLLKHGGCQNRQQNKKFIQ